METLTLDNDIEVYRVKAKSFPMGVDEAHKTLHSLVAFSEKRKYFGISHPEKGTIAYWAAAEELNAGEFSKHNLEKFVIKKGKYVYKDIPDFMSKLPMIGQTFQEILHTQKIDPNGACVEWYL